MKMGGFKGGEFIPLLQAQRASKLLFSCTVCYACLGKLHRLHDGDFGKNTILEKHKIGNRRASNFKFFGGIAKVGKSFAEIKSYKQTPVLSL